MTYFDGEDDGIDWDEVDDCDHDDYDVDILTDRPEAGQPQQVQVSHTVNGSPNPKRRNDDGHSVACQMVVA